MAGVQRFKGPILREGRGKEGRRKGRGRKGKGKGRGRGGIWPNQKFWRSAPNDASIEK